MASRGVTAAPRGKFSGLPFGARLSDVAASAGLTAPTIYGSVDRNDYIIEAIGCGVAFFECDNDGFEDIFITGWPQNILYRNNRDGTFTDVTKESGLLHEGARWGTGCTFVDFDRDGNLDLFVSHYLKRSFLQFQRCPGKLRAARVAARNKLSVSQQWKRRLHRC